MHSHMIQWSQWTQKHPKYALQSVCWQKRNHIFLIFEASRSRKNSDSGLFEGKYQVNSYFYSFDWHIITAKISGRFCDLSEGLQKMDPCQNTS